jgi:hypothetical protein
MAEADMHRGVVFLCGAGPRVPTGTGKDGVLSTWTIHDAQVVLKKFDYFQKVCWDILRARPDCNGWSLRFSTAVLAG